VYKRQIDDTLVPEWVIEQIKPNYIGLSKFERLVAGSSLSSESQLANKRTSRLLTIAGDSIFYRLRTSVLFPFDELLRYLKKAEFSDLIREIFGKTLGQKEALPK
jgi:hypothetical protein